MEENFKTFFQRVPLGNLKKDVLNNSEKKLGKGERNNGEKEAFYVAW